MPAGETVMIMNTSSEAVDRGRRWFLGTAATGLVAAGAASLLPSQSVAAPSGDVIRPFRINIPEQQLLDLSKRISATRWPDQETVNDRSQGVQLTKFRETMHYWATDYDWRKLEARLNALP
jgi:hypothetical protein